MSTLGDQTIIDNTHFEHNDEGKLVCYTNLPDGTRYAQAVSSMEAVQKNMIGWCNTVRDYLKMMEDIEEQEREAKRKKKDSPLPAPTAEPRSDTIDPKALVLEHYENLRSSRIHIEETITELEDQLELVEEELNELSPVIKAWKGVKGET